MGLCLAAFFSGCRKTLELEYDNVPSKLVVNAEVSNVEMKVLLTRTSDMTEPMDNTPVKDAIVSIKGDDGFEEVLAFAEDGFYRSTTEAYGRPGVTYTLRIQCHDTICTAQSKMPGYVPVDSIVFSWVPILGDIEIRTVQMYLNDPQDEENFYYAKIVRDGDVMYRALYDDSGMKGEADNIMKGLMGKSEWEDAEKEKANGAEPEDDIVYVGDLLDFEVRMIDRDAYLYLSSLSTNTSSAVNPTTNLKGNGCLGYFSAFAVSMQSLVYQDN